MHIVVILSVFAAIGSATPFGSNHDSVPDLTTRGDTGSVSDLGVVQCDPAYNCKTPTSPVHPRTQSFEVLDSLRKRDGDDDIDSVSATTVVGAGRLIWGDVNPQDTIVDALNNLCASGAHACDLSPYDEDSAYLGQGEEYVGGSVYFTKIRTSGKLAFTIAPGSQYTDDSARQLFINYFESYVETTAQYKSEQPENYDGPSGDPFNVAILANEIQITIVATYESGVKTTIADVAVSIAWIDPDSGLCEDIAHLGSAISAGFGTVTGAAGLGSAFFSGLSLACDGSDVPTA